MIYQLLYTSDPNPALDGDDIARILYASRRNNPSSGITGLLVHSKHAFLQVLEGQQADVLDKYDIIRSDPRHRNCEIVHEQMASTRSFPNWAMAARHILPGGRWCDGIPEVGSARELAQLARGRALMLRSLLTEFGIVHFDADMCTVFERQEAPPLPLQ